MSDVASAATGPLDQGEHRALGRDLSRRRLREYLSFDSVLARKLAAAAGITFAWGLRLVGKKDKALSLGAAIHRGNYSTLADRLVERWVRRAATGDQQLFARYIEQLRPQPATE